jgi:transcriptional regulator with XRE-family HTH domain
LNYRTQTKATTQPTPDKNPTCAGIHAQSAISNTFGEHLFELRKNRNLSQAQAAALCGISTAYYSGLENSKRHPPPLNRVVNIARRLGSSNLRLEAILEDAERERFCWMHLRGIPDGIQLVITSLISSADKLPPGLSRDLMAWVETSRAQRYQHHSFTLPPQSETLVVEDAPVADKFKRLGAKNRFQ